MRYSKKNDKRHKIKRSRIQNRNQKNKNILKNNKNILKNKKKLQNKANMKINRKKKYLSRKAYKKNIRNYSDKVRKTLKTNQVIRKVRKNQAGGGPIDMVMSMMPFGLGKNVQNAGAKIILDDDESEDEDNEELEKCRTQSVLVNTLCNRYLKNNIKGKDETEYDAILENLCSNQQINMPTGMNSFSNSLYFKKSNNKKKKKKKKKNSKKKSKLRGQAQDGGFQMPSFLSGVTGLTKLYSAPLRMGYNALNNGYNSLKNRSKHQQTTGNEQQQTKGNEQQQTKGNEQQQTTGNEQQQTTGNEQQQTTGKAESNQVAGNGTKVSIDEDIRKAEEEIEAMNINSIEKISNSLNQIGESMNVNINNNNNNNNSI